MPRNAVVLLHRCFDPLKFNLESAGSMENAFVRFPKANCSCAERIRFRERNDLLAKNLAVVVLRDGAEPSADKFTWNEVVACRPGRTHLHARTMGTTQIAGAASFANLTDAELRDYEKEIRSDLESLVGRLETASPNEMPGLSDRIGELNMELRALSAFLNEQKRIGRYEHESVYPYVRLSEFSCGAFLIKPKPE